MNDTEKVQLFAARLLYRVYGDKVINLTDVQNISDEIFSYLDKNSDGKLTYKEFKTMAESIDAETFAELMKNHTNAAQRGVAELTNPELANKSDFRDNFPELVSRSGFIDKNGDSQIETIELIHAIDVLEKNLPKEKKTKFPVKLREKVEKEAEITEKAINLLKSEVDKNKDGQLSKEEAIEMIRILKSCDADGDGKTSPIELKALLTELKQKQK